MQKKCVCKIVRTILQTHFFFIIFYCYVQQLVTVMQLNREKNVKKNNSICIQKLVKIERFAKAFCKVEQKQAAKLSKQKINLKLRKHFPIWCLDYCYNCKSSQ